MPEAIDQLINAMPNLGFDWNILGQTIGIIILVACFIGLAIFIKKKKPIKRFPTVVLVHEILKDDQTRPYLTSGRRTGGLTEFQEYELKNGDKIQPFSYKDLSVLPNGKKFLELDKLEDGRYIPHRTKIKDKQVIQTQKVFVTDPENPGKIIEKELEYAINLYEQDVNQTDINHTVDHIRRSIDLFSSKGFWAKYAIPIIVVMVLFAGIAYQYVHGQYVVLPTIQASAGIAQANAINTERLDNMSTRWIEYMERDSQLRERELLLLSKVLNVSLDGIPKGTVVP